MLRPYLIATLGYPGSGKTYFSENLARAENFVHLNADKERLRLFKRPQYTPEEHQTLSEAMDQSAKELLMKGVSVIYDVNFNKRIHRKRVEVLAEMCGAEYWLVHILTRHSVALDRLKVRGRDNTQNPELYRPIDSEVFYSMKAELENPGESENVIRIDGEAPFDEQLSQFKKYV